jgi:hypothetical protein
MKEISAYLAGISAIESQSCVDHGCQACLRCMLLETATQEGPVGAMTAPPGRRRLVGAYFGAAFRLSLCDQWPPLNTGVEFLWNYERVAETNC